MTIAFTGFEASQIHEPEWAIYNHLNDDLTRIGQEVTAAGGDRTVSIAVGSTRIKGILCQANTAVTRQTSSNGSSNPRIDALRWRIDWSAKEATLGFKQGTPASSPSPPAMTQQVNNIWEEPIATVRVGPGQGAFGPNDITPIAPRSSAHTGWRPISNATPGSIGNFDIHFPPGFEMYRLTMRGRMPVPGSIRCRVNNSSSPHHLTGWVTMRSTGTIVTGEGDTHSSQFTSTRWFIGHWGNVIGNHLEMLITDVTEGSFPSYSARSTRLSPGSASSHRIMHSWGRLDSAATVNFIRLFAYEGGAGAGGSAQEFRNLQWALEGYRFV